MGGFDFGNGLSFEDISNLKSRDNSNPNLIALKVDKDQYKFLPT